MGGRCSCCANLNPELFIVSGSRNNTIMFLNKTGLNKTLFQSKYIMPRNTLLY